MPTEPDPISAEIRELAWRFRHDDLDAAGRRRLDLLVRQSEAALREYVAAMHVLVGLEISHAPEEVDRLGRLAAPPHAQPARSPLLGFLGDTISRLPGAEFTVGLVVMLGVAVAFWGLATFVLKPGEQRGDAPLADAPAKPRSHEPAPVDSQAAVFARLAPGAGCEWAADSPLAAAGAAAGLDLQLGQNLDLVSGTAEIVFGSGTRLAIEGPVRVSLKSVGVCDLEFGRLFARVPHAAVGFTITTPTADVVDLGTEFGVEVDPKHATKVQVITGQVQVHQKTGGGGAGSGGRRLTAGSAIRISADGTKIEPIPFDASLAASSGSKVRPVAENRTAPLLLDVVDMVAGGDGSGHSRGIAIDPRNGNFGALRPVIHAFPGDDKFHVTPSHRVVDGCFVPNGTMQVDSAGHTFQFANTSGKSCNFIWAGGTIPWAPGVSAPENPKLGNVDYSQPGHGALMLVANKGLTFDLNALRRFHRQFAPRRFQAVGGNCCPWPTASTADFLILVDGRLRFERRNFTRKDGPFDIDVPLNDEDAFLTLVTCDGSPSGDEPAAITDDYVICGDPLIQLSPLSASP